ncbi:MULTISPECIES: MBL fold metallo-hydrolase [Metallosphaera]|uniref:Exonuclease of the beta-lactamase fold involved in RNA processing-like protein n=3 Tax=Metallosphaera TaxID=41980 RepID=A4YD24_METS5|nr:MULTISPECIES: MBL fold metallo-hydrolase [Metallosphaera]ABP94326.1 exonuclease of the beta-lactamase fold involved in RNA processing-like protein [Metallosphaera sedula DSM 5348]AIM26313.1 exonuclease of the beta-lactamase fold involved in RNA processing-like protein [Metallosphaera sedula]AKV73325.1 exonuclease [Metallosphaera sedula]AKV75569.1 exonuclease [Metallosphaera sedula]AKV77815.1 exonuclease [Metallosphaera sedula]
MNVRIERNGAILIGENFTVDGHWKRNFRIVTHFHSDHTLQLSSSVKECLGVIATPPTMQVLEVLGYKIARNKRLDLNYGVTINVDEERLTLHPSDHVFGSAQVEIITNEETIAYTGDFKNPEKGTPILNPDILIIESTYGKPEFTRKFKGEVEQLMSDFINDAVVKMPVRIYGYHGKLQEVMRVLRKNGVIAPFIVDGKVRDITRIAISNGIQIEDVFSKEEAEAQGILKDRWYIEFLHFNQFKQRDSLHANFLLSGWEFEVPVKRIDKVSTSIAFSDHADFEDLIYYVDNSKAKLIIAEGGRRGYSKELSKHIRNILKRNSISLPE